MDSENKMTEKANGPTKRFYHLMSEISVEPVVFLYCLGMTVATFITQNIYYDKICKVGSVWFGNGTTFPEELCNQLDNGNFTEEQKYVQEIYNQMIMVVRFGNAFVPAVFILFLGPWSDVGGRRFLIYLPTVGFIVKMSTLLLNAVFFYELTADFLMLETLASLFGGESAFFMGW